jgi:flagellar motor switch protein FliN/FliY
MSPAEPALQTTLPPDDAAPPPANAAQLIAMTELDGPRPGEPDHANGTSRAVASLMSAVAERENPLRHVKARLTVCVGAAELTVGELLGAKEQQVVRLDRTVDQPVDLLLEGHVVARGMLVAIDDRFAVRITELPIPLELSSGAHRKP